MKFTLILYAMRAVTTIARAATWLLSRWNRRRAFDRAMKRLNESTDAGIKQAAEVAAKDFDEFIRTHPEAIVLDGKTVRFFDNGEEAESFKQWVLDPDLAEMSEQEFEYKEQN